WIDGVDRPSALALPPFTANEHPGRALQKIANGWHYFGTHKRRFFQVVYSLRLCPSKIRIAAARDRRPRKSDTLPDRRVAQVKRRDVHSQLFKECRLRTSHDLDQCVQLLRIEMGNGTLVP